MMLIVLAPLVWHEWQVVMDSSHFIPTIAYAGLFWDSIFIPYPTVTTHVIDSWKVAKLPGGWETTELSIFTSLFIGATAAVGTIAALGAWGKLRR